MVIGLSGVQAGSNRASEITSTITPELYDTKSYYQLIVSITKCEKLRNEIFNASA